jgi:hypothetical protein
MILSTYHVRPLGPFHRSLPWMFLFNSAKHSKRWLAIPWSFSGHLPLAIVFNPTLISSINSVV